MSPRATFSSGSRFVLVSALFLFQIFLRSQVPLNSSLCRDAGVSSPSQAQNSVRFRGRLSRSRFARENLIISPFVNVVSTNLPIFSSFALHVGVPSRFVFFHSTSTSNLSFFLTFVLLYFGGAITQKWV
jgi:hypothetical protein